jgi:hypothetical protein
MMRSISLDEAQLATLTPEEQAAITGDDFTEDEVKAIQGAPATDDADDDGDDGDSDEVVDANGKPVVEKPAEAPAPTADATHEPEPADAKPVRNEYVAKMPEDYDQKITDLAAKESEIRAQFKNGDLPLDDYEEQRDAILKERESLNTSRVKSEISQEMREQAAQNEWQSQIKSFMATAAKNDGVDYRKDDVKSGDLDLFVKTLAQNPAHADKSGEWFLAEAHKRVMALHGIAAKSGSSGDVAQPKAAASRKPPLGSAPKTLAQVPGGDGPGDVGDEFANLDSLSGDALDDAIKKMTPAMHKKYLGL